MKNIFGLILLSFIVIKTGFSQNESMTYFYTEEFVSNLNPPAVYRVKAQKIIDGYRILIIPGDSSDNTGKSFPLTNLDFQVFTTMLKANIKKFREEDYDSSIMDKKAIGLFFNLNSSAAVINEQRIIAGTLETSKNVPLYSNSSKFRDIVSQRYPDLNNSQKSKNPQSNSAQRVGLLDIEDIQVEIRDGAIETIYIVGKDSATKKTLFFRNYYPISFSGLNDYENPTRYLVWENRRGGPTFFLCSDLLKYVPEIYPESKDYSPENKAYRFEPGKTYPLLKEETSRILKAKVFTDLVGLSQNEPNGLVQTEVARKINLSTIKYQTVRDLYFGILSFVEPFISLTKIEQNNKSIPVKNKFVIENNQLKNIRYLSTLELQQYQNLIFGASLNVFQFGFPLLKSVVETNFRLQYGRTSVQDSVHTLENGKVVTLNAQPDRFNLNTFQFNPFVAWHVKPDPRYGISFLLDWNFFYLENPNVVQIGSIKDYEIRDSTYKNGDYIVSVAMKAHLKTGLISNSKERSDQSNGEFFFRCSYNFLWSERIQNYFQAQLGYSFYILKKN